MPHHTNGVTYIRRIVVCIYSGYTGAMTTTSMYDIAAAASAWGRPECADCLKTIHSDATTVVRDGAIVTLCADCTKKEN